MSFKNKSAINIFSDKQKHRKFIVRRPTFQKWNALKKFFRQFSSVQSLSRVRLFAAPWIAARQASLSITNSRSSLKLTSIESVMPSSHLIGAIKSDGNSDFGEEMEEYWKW